jgi:hypothetical protein
LLSRGFFCRLTDATHGRKLGWFVSKRSDWKPGDWIGQRAASQMVVVAVVEPEDGADFHAHLIVVSPETLLSDRGGAT